MLEYNDKLLESPTVEVTESESSTFVWKKNNNDITTYIGLLENIVSNINKPKDITMELSQANNDKQINTLTENNKRIPKEIDIPKYTLSFIAKSPLLNSFYVNIREYNGEVISIENHGGFTANLVNVADSKDILQVEFNDSDIDERERYLLRVGALFIWIIGKEECNGTQRKISQLVFRRASSWTKRDIKRIEEVGKNRATAIRKLFAENNTSST